MLGRLRQEDYLSLEFKARGEYSEILYQEERKKKRREKEACLHTGMIMVWRGQSWQLGNKWVVVESQRWVMA